ncbi:MAG: 3-deoxy-D-manno-octulosonic acid kinase [Steroidobacteraceae bacterium]
MSRDWKLGPGVKRVAVAGGAMLYDASRVSNFSEAWFDANWWPQRDAVEGDAGGRGSTWFVRGERGVYALRHYRRGGLAAKFVHDRYLWTGESETRPFAEWGLTYHMRRAGLPVPVPIAARYRRAGLTYTGDLITMRLADAQPLAMLLTMGALSLETWIAIGRCIGRFHEFDVCHADLNAHNVLLTDEGRVFLVDFDRGELRRPGLWQDGNLVRLRRSLEKVIETLPAERFTEQDWHSFLDGYYQVRRTPLASTPAR